MVPEQSGESQMSHDVAYRPEIDGLRAVAVAAVIAYHLWPLEVPGGYLGVDVFFVISGFLISSIILRQLQAGTFSMGSFWLRRVRRLMPALVVMLAAVLLAGQFILVPPDRVALGQHVLATLLSYSNILIRRWMGDYWAPLAESLPLLHTWSLSVEEQFYLLAPLTFAWLWRRGWGVLRGAVFAGAAGSLLLSMVVWRFHSSVAFYWLPMRAWELLLGTAVALLLFARGGRGLEKRFSAVVAAAGLFLVVVACACGIGRSWYSPLVPCAGTALVILSGVRGIASQLLGWRPVVYVGRASYSLYLWHWPVIALAKFVTAHPPAVVLLPLMSALGLLSYHFVETPLRVRGHRLARPVLAFGCVLCVASLGVFALASAGLVKTEVAKLEASQSDVVGEGYEMTDAIVAGRLPVNQRRVDVAIMGSSHARMLSPGLATFGAKAGLELAYLGSSGVGLTLEGSQAGEINSKRLDWLRVAHPRVLIVADKWSYWFAQSGFDERLKQSLAALSEVADQVLVLAQVPSIVLPAGAGELRKALLVAYRDGEWPAAMKADSDVPRANALVAELVKACGQSHVSFVDVYPEFVTADGGVRFEADDVVLYADHNHLNKAGAVHEFEGLLGRRVTAALKRAGP